jgi:hypothetical protein
MVVQQWQARATSNKSTSAAGPPLQVGLPGGHPPKGAPPEAPPSLAAPHGPERPQRWPLSLQESQVQSPAVPLHLFLASLWRATGLWGLLLPQGRVRVRQVGCGGTAAELGISQTAIVTVAGCIHREEGSQPCHSHLAAGQGGRGVHITRRPACSQQDWHCLPG